MPSLFRHIFALMTVIAVLAPGFAADPLRGELAVELTRITFPYLLLITLVTLYGGMLNVMHRFASAAAAPIFLNLSMMTTLALAAFFPGVGHAAAWGVLIAGFLEFFLLAGDAARSGILPKFAPLKLDEDVRAFFRALGPATLGSMGTQVALFADTIIATFLPAGALSALYYADRLNQLPIGVIGIAVGTVEVFDPVADPEEVRHEYGIDIMTSPDQLTSTYEGIMVAVAHDAFRSLDLNRLKGRNCLVYDAKNLYPDADAYL
mgnify:CR=1 FL=1